MQTGKLTSHDRVARMFARQDQDRVPRFDQFCPETLGRWKSEGMDGDPHQLFDFDIVRLGWVAPAPYPGRDELIAETEETRDTINEWGAKVRVWKKRSGTPEHFGWECDSPMAWWTNFRRKIAPDSIRLDLPAMRATFDEARKNHKWTCLCGIQTYEALKAMIGDEAMLLAMIDEPQWIRDVSTTYTNTLITIYQRILNNGIRPDAVWIFDDLAFSSGPLCSPTMYRTLIMPDHRRVADWAHRHGLKLIFHTDGNVNCYMDLFIQAGIDCLQPLEAKAGMDLRTLVPQYSSRLAFFGNIDMAVAISNDAAQVEEEVRAKLAAGMAGKGYMYHSDHSVPPEVSWKTYQLIMDIVDVYGAY